MLKKCLIIMLLVIISTISIPTYAYNNVTIKLDGKVLKFDAETKIINDEPLVPLEELLEKMGYELITTNKGLCIEARRQDTKINLRIYSKTVYSNDKKITLDSPISKKGGVPMMSIDFLRKVLRAKVEWDKGNNKLTIKSANDIKVHFIEGLGGEAILIDYDDYDVLIDVGVRNEWGVVSNYLEKLEIDDIELLVLSHIDEEHVGGLSEIISNFKVEKIIRSKGGDDKYWKENFMNQDKKGEKIKIIEDSDLKIDLGSGVYFHVIEIGDNNVNENNNSVVTMLEHNDVKILFTGDMESDAELRNLDKFTDVDIVKLANLGLGISSSKEFIEKIMPEIAVAFATKDKLEEELVREVSSILLEKGIKLYTTGEYGNIVITTDGDSYEVDSYDVSGIKVNAINFNTRDIILTNLTDKEMDLSGCIVLDTKENERYYIKSGSAIESHGYAVFQLIKEDGEEFEWEDYDPSYGGSDEGILYDRDGNVIYKYLK